MTPTKPTHTPTPDEVDTPIHKVRWLLSDSGRLVYSLLPTTWQGKPDSKNGYSIQFSADRDLGGLSSGEAVAATRVHQCLVALASIPGDPEVALALAREALDYAATLVDLDADGLIARARTALGGGQ